MYMTLYVRVILRPRTTHYFSLAHGLPLNSVVWEAVKEAGGMRSEALLSQKQKEGRQISEKPASFHCICILALLVYEHIWTITYVV